MGAVLDPLHPALTHVSRHVLDQRSARQGTASFPSNTAAESTPPFDRQEDGQGRGQRGHPSDARQRGLFPNPVWRRVTYLPDPVSYDPKPVPPQQLRPAQRLVHAPNAFYPDKESLEFIT